MRRSTGLDRAEEAHLDAKKRTVGLHATAKGATGFICTLYRNHRLLFSHACGSTKNYSNPLKPGSYSFFVWGVNQPGSSKIPATRSFKLH